MESKELISLGLNLREPWFVSDVSLEREGTELILHIHIDHLKRTKFHLADELCPVYDHQTRQWEHLNFFEHKCILHAKVPRVKTKDGKVRLVDVPWAEAGSSFTLKFEHYVLALVQHGMSASSAARHLGHDPRTIFRIIKRYTIAALFDQKLDKVEHLSIDETSSRKGHNYLTILGDRKQKKVVGISVGKSSESMEAALEEMEIRGAKRIDVRYVTMDMSTSYIKGANEQLEQATIIFDRFHVMKKMNEALDEIRREERKNYEQLKNSRYLWLKNAENLTAKQRDLVLNLKDID